MLRAEKAGIKSPKALAFRNNIIVEEFIGNEDPAPALKDAHPNNPQKFFREIISQMKKLYQEGLIHGDLSSFNILNYKDKPYFIDFSQATLVRTPNSEELLERDVRNILSFFKKFGLNEDISKTIQKIKK